MRHWLLRRLSVSDRTGRSLADRFRRKRWEYAQRLLGLTGSESVVDVGGDNRSWWFADWRGSLVRCNIRPVTDGVTVTADGCCLPFPDNAFDLAFSNSVIEHLPSHEAQVQYAKELMRVGRRFFLQTPNYWFPIEPHYVFPFFQFLPLAVRRWLHTHFALGNFTPGSPFPVIRLLTRAELVRLFPRARIIAERFGPLVKSWYVVG